MQKLLDFLEENVQWVAMGLAGIFLLWMAWGYLAHDPVSETLTTISGQKEVVTPRNIGSELASGPAQQLDAAMSQGSKIDVKTDDLAGKIMSALRGQEVVALAPWPWMGTPWETLPQKAEIQKPEDNTANAQKEGPAGAQVTQLPANLSPATFVKSSSGMSIVLEQAAAAAGNPANADAQGKIDKDWVSLQWKLPVKDIASAFQAANLPPAAVTDVVRVELIRQEVDSNGQAIGPEEIVPPLKIHQVPAFPAAGNLTAEVAYLAWVTKNDAADLLAPVFYQVTGGDQWWIDPPNPNLLPKTGTGPDANQGPTPPGQNRTQPQPAPADEWGPG